MIFAMLLHGCDLEQKNIIIEEDPPLAEPSEPNIPSEPTDLEIARECVNNSAQNVLAYSYSYAGSQPLQIRYVNNNFPLNTTFYFSGGNTYFTGSTINIQVIYHASGGDIELANEQFDNTHTASFDFDAFSSPMYMATAEDEFTVNITSNIVATVDGKTKTYPEYVESFDFTLDDTAPAFNQYQTGVLRLFDSSLDCKQYFNPHFYLTTRAAAAPDEFDIEINGLMATYPLDTFYSASQKISPPVFFERSFECVIKSIMGVNVSAFVLSQPDTTIEPYATPFGTFSASLPAGFYTLDLNSTVNVDFGAGMKTSNVSSSFDFEIEAMTGDIFFDGEEYNGKQAIELGLSLFE